MDAVRIVWTKIAIKQRDQIFNYWNERNKSVSYSSKLNIIIVERLHLLKQFPEMGKLVDHKNTRVIFFDSYSIFYTITNVKIIITAFWDNRQDPNKIRTILK
ncbi:MAG: type II toxin-antitoxin system RelE/ParE family toxin [Polaribacter sp.]